MCTLCFCYSQRFILRGVGLRDSGNIETVNRQAFGGLFIQNQFRLIQISVNNSSLFSFHWNRLCKFIVTMAITGQSWSTLVTNQGKRMFQSMAFQHSQANIKGDMSTFMKNIENFISN